MDNLKLNEGQFKQNFWTKESFNVTKQYCRLGNISESVKILVTVKVHFMSLYYQNKKSLTCHFAYTSFREYIF